ncbi:MAG: metal-dependent hydrolase [Planctomycetes bacterium]|nr:metal-dependent hydrolase [Planctomycetota bacterium]
MAGFKTHVTVSSTLGIGYAAAGYLAFEMPWPSCVLAGGLCGVAGMMPDLDSASGRPIRESTAFAAAVVPLLLIDRFQHIGLETESMVLAGALIYLLIRFGAGKLLKMYAVHRGMFHSIPAALIAGMLGFMICGCTDIDARMFKGGAVFAGYMSHLMLDEIYSIDWSRGVPRLKKSFGTAIKMWGRSLSANLATYAKLFALLFIMTGDVTLLGGFDAEDHSHAQHAAHEDGQASKSDEDASDGRIRRIADRLLGRLRD